MSAFADLVSGLYFGGESSLAEPARLRFDGASFCLERDGKEARTYRADEASVSDRVGSIPRSFSFPDGGRFESAENDLIDAWMSRLGKKGFSARLEASSRFVGFLGLGFVLLLALVYWVILPAASDDLARRVPESVLQSLSGGVREWVEKNTEKGSAHLSATDQAKVIRVYERIKAKFPEARFYFYTVHVTGLGANAFALPDGTIFVTDSLVPSLTEDEIVAVLLHEVGHVRLRHGLSHLIQTSVLSLIVFAVAGGDGTTIPLLLLGAAYSRKHETAADAFAKTQLLQLGLRPSLLSSALKKLMAANGMSESQAFSYISSHPLTEEREKALGSGE
jgi:Zn-dependent protease with chaperone function